MILKIEILLKIVKCSDNGIMWTEFDKIYFSLDSDVYFSIKYLLFLNNRNSVLTFHYWGYFLHYRLPHRGDKTFRISGRCLHMRKYKCKNQTQSENPKTFDKLPWTASRHEDLLNNLEDKIIVFEETFNFVSNDNIGQSDKQIHGFTQLILVFGRRSRKADKPKKKGASWFNADFDNHNEFINYGR